MPTTPLLIVMRHAKTNVSSPTGDDFSRALTPRGSADALAMGEWLHAQHPGLARIVSSTALRARQTVAAVTLPWGAAPPESRWDPALYLAELDTLLGAVESLREAPTLLVGHNPGLEDLVHHLVGDLHARIGSPKSMPTSAAYVLELSTRRGQPRPGSAVLRAHMRPKLLAAGTATDDDD